MYNKNKLFFYLISIFFIILIFIITIFITNHQNQISKDITKYVYEYEEVDISHTCSLYNCKYIKFNDITYVNNNYSISKYPQLIQTEHIPNITMLFGGIGVTTDMDILLIIDSHVYDGYLIVSQVTILDIINNYYFYALMVFMLFNLFFSFYNISNYNKIQMKNNILLQTESYYKSMMLLTENINHELNTPLRVIDNSIKNIMKLKPEEHCSYYNNNLHRYISFIQISSNQISDLVNRMSPFKDIKNNDVPILYTIVKNICDLIHVSNHDTLTYDIDTSLNDFLLNIQYLKKGELITILLNMVKNSIDANCSNIKIKLHSYTNDTATILIADNGNGIDKEYVHDIFNECSSSKGCGRGSGLYINKSILKTSHGDISLQYTSSYGTVFALTIPVIRIAVPIKND